MSLYVNRNARRNGRLSKLVQRRGALSILCATLFSIGLTGCFVPNDDKPEPPRLAVLQVAHQNQQQGLVEVLFDGVPVLEVSFGSTDAAVTIPVGSGSFSFRSAGAVSPFFESDVFDLSADRVYTFALVDEEIESSLVLDLTAPPPPGEPDLHWVRFVNLSSLNEGRIFRGTDPVEDLPLDENPSAFMSVESASSTLFSISDAGGAPLEIVDNVRLPSGGSSLVLIGDTQQEDGVALYVLPLDEERIIVSMDNN